MIEWESGSYRDRTARVFYRNQHVYRMLTERAGDAWKRLKASGLLDTAVNSGRMVATQEVGDTASWELPADCTLVLEHERIPFISYPYEWSFTMLKEAARLHLDLLLDALPRKLILKDATPYNVQWRGTVPIFLDVTSFAPLEEGAPWQAYGQFCQMFLFPLMLTAYRDVPFQPWLRGSLEGIPVGQMRPLLGAFDLLRPGVLTEVMLHDMLDRKAAASRNVRSQLRVAGFTVEMLKANIRRLRGLLDRIVWKQKESTWSDYSRTHGYGEADFEVKKTFVERALSRQRWAQAWDLGANAGAFSRLAARHSDYVLALEGDALCVERMFHDLRTEGVANVLPLVMNLVDASPGQGWQGTERKRLEERGRPSIVLCLALLHHLVLSANLRIGDFIEWIADQGADLIIEFIDRDDPQAARLLERRDEPCDEYMRAHFEQCLRNRYEVIDTREVCDGRRVLYSATRRH